MVDLEESQVNTIFTEATDAGQVGIQDKVEKPVRGLTLPESREFRTLNGIQVGQMTVEESDRFKALLEKIASKNPKPWHGPTK